MIITIASEKGGTGKTTIASNLAILRSHRKKDVILIDADPQGSSKDFCLVREEEKISPNITCVSMFGRMISTEAMKLRTKFDDVFIDVGGRDSAGLRSALLISDIVIIPFLPSQLDVWSLEKVDVLMEEVLALNDKLKILCVLNKVDTNPRISLTEEANEFSSELKFIKPLKTYLCYRVAYRKAIAEGRSVTELDKKDPKAIQEITQLYKEVFG